MKSYIVYGVTTIVIVVSVICVVFLPVNNELKTMFSLPGILGLFSLLVQGWRDQIAHERAIELQSKQHDFDVAIASHMTNVVFDKQVNFCEEYTKELHSIVFQMFQEGPQEKTSSYATRLRNVRVSYAPWISKELLQKIKPFEATLLQIGALGMLSERNPNNPQRSQHIDKMFNDYTKFLGISMEGIPREPESAADVVVEHFTEILNVYDLEILRRSTIRLAREKLKE
jgi:hypothetical protein